MIGARVLFSVAGAVLSLLSLAPAGDASLAQLLQQPAVSTPGLSELLSDPGRWLTDMFNAAVLATGQKTTGDIVGFMNWLMGGGNVISQTPAALSYRNPAVVELADRLRGYGNLLLVVVTVWGGVNLIVHPHVRAPYHGALELIPRVLLSGIMVNTSLGWGGFVVELNNALCRAIGAVSLPGWTDVQHLPGGDSLLLNLIGMVVYLVLGMLLLGQMLMRLALVDALLVIAPLALLCWVLPQTYSWARLWFTTFFGTVFVQTIQVLVLRLGADLIRQLPSLLVALGSNPVDTSGSPPCCSASRSSSWRARSPACCRAPPAPRHRPTPARASASSARSSTPARSGRAASDAC
jgi:hypothetical protein